MNLVAILNKVSLNTFEEIIESAPRKIREALYSHYSLKNKGGLLRSFKQKRKEKNEKLKECLKNSKSDKESDFIKELIRNWLFKQRSLLKSALDFLKVPNDNGLINEEPDFFKKLSKEKVSELTTHLREKNFSKDHIYLYLSFMETPHLEPHLYSAGQDFLTT